MMDDICHDATAQMEKAVEAFKRTLTTVRAGRAHTSLLDGVKVDYYGSPTPLSQVATVSAPDARLLTVKPWEKNLLGDIERAIMEANIGLNPMNDGDLVRVPIPPLSEERRREMVKQAKGKAEDAKLAVRNARRDANDMLKSATKDGDISEDDEKRGLKNVQESTDSHVKLIDSILGKKEAEIMEV